MGETADISHAAGDYLKAIWSLSPRGAVGTSAIADALGLSPASVSNMLVRLREAGLVEYERYRGARLSELGRREALRLIRRHRLIETFMIETLGYSWDEVHREAEAIEHAISDRFAERLAAYLGHPTHDPHGDPIPDSHGALPATPNTPLSELPTGAALEVARLLSQDSTVLEHLAELGIRPGTTIRIEGRDPDEGRIWLWIDGVSHAVSEDFAHIIRGLAI